MAKFAEKKLLKVKSFVLFSLQLLPETWCYIYSVHLSSTHKFYFQLLPSVFMIHHVLDTYCSHHQGATILSRHKQHNVHQ